MKVFAVSMNPDDLKKPKGMTLKNFPVPMPKDELEKLNAYCREHGINRCEWARRVLIESFSRAVSKESA